MSTTMIQAQCHSIGVTRVDEKTVIGIDGMKFYIITQESTREVFIRFLKGKVIENARAFIPKKEDNLADYVYNLVFDVDGKYVNIITVSE